MQACSDICEEFELGMYARNHIYCRSVEREVTHTYHCLPSPLHLTLYIPEYCLLRVTRLCLPPARYLVLFGVPERETLEEAFGRNNPIWKAVGALLGWVSVSAIARFFLKLFSFVFCWLVCCLSFCLLFFELPEARRGRGAGGSTIHVCILRRGMVSTILGPSLKYIVFSVLYITYRSHRLVTVGCDE